MKTRDIARRSLLKEGADRTGRADCIEGCRTHAIAGADYWGSSSLAGPAATKPCPAANVGKLLRWETLDTRLTPAENFFYVNHYGQPDGLDEARWRVSIGGLVAQSPLADAGRPQSSRPPRSGIHVGVLGQH